MSISREITHLVKRSTGKMVGEWPGDSAAITDDQIFELFTTRASETIGMSMERATFDEMYEVVRYIEITKH